MIMRSISPLKWGLNYSLALLMLAILGQCGTAQKENSAARTSTDAYGRAVPIPTQKPLKVMGLSPALTEILFSVVPDSEIVAVSHVCNYPAAALAKPKVNTYPLAMESLVALKPDLIFAEEGIVSLESAAQMERMGLKTYFFRYKDLGDVWRAIDTIGALTGHSIRAQKVTDSLRAVQQQIGLAAVSGAKPIKVLGLISDKPIYAWGPKTIFNHMLKLAGATNAISDTFSKAYPELTREYVLKINPDIIIGGTKAELDSSFFALYPELKRINAYQKGQMYKINGDVLTRPGPRILQAVQEMATYVKQAQR